MGIFGTVLGGILQAGAAKKATNAQTAAANQDMAFQTETRDLIRNDLAPFRQGGTTAQQALMFELGLGNRPMIGGNPAAIETIAGGPATNAFGGGGLATLGFGGRDGAERRVAMQGQQPATSPTQYRVNGQTFGTMEEAQAFANANKTGGAEYGGYTKAPGYDFRMKEGVNALQSGAAARGGLYSGAAMRDLQSYGQDYSTSEYDKFLSRIGAMSDTGMSAAQMSGNASQNAAAGVSNALGNIGNAQAAGAIAKGNAFSSGINDALGVYNYQRQNPNGAGNNWLFGGKGLGGFS